MPIYDFKCKNTECLVCTEDKTLTHLTKIANRDDLLECPNCHEPLKRVQTVPGGPHLSWSKWRAI